jgi:hypothetical protein
MLENGENNISSLSCEPSSPAKALFFIPTDKTDILHFKRRRCTVTNPAEAPRSMLKFKLRRRKS